MDEFKSDGGMQADLAASQIDSLTPNMKFSP
jgi:hypothetical protein